MRNLSQHDSNWQEDHWNKLGRTFFSTQYCEAKQSLTVIQNFCLHRDPCSAQPLGNKSRAMWQHQQVLPGVQEVTQESHAKLICLQPAAFITHSNSLFIGLDNVIVEVLVVFDHVQWDDKIHIHIGIAQLVESDVHSEQVIPHIFNAWLQAFAHHVPAQQGREISSFPQPTFLPHSHYKESFPNPRKSFLLNILRKMQTDLSLSHRIFLSSGKTGKCNPI